MQLTRTARKGTRGSKGTTAFVFEERAIANAEIVALS